MKFFTIFKNNISSFYIFIPLLLILPIAIYIFLDAWLWPWDQALYGERTIDLYKSLRRDSFIQYINLFFNIMGSKAPAICWVGQFFVPFHKVFNNIDTALLLQILLLSFLTLVLVYKIVYHYYKSYFISFLTCLILSSNSLFLGLVHQYYVEIPQLFSVTLLYYFITKIKVWHPYTVGLNTISVICYGLIVKISTPLYMFFPSLYILFKLIPELKINHNIKTYFVFSLQHHIINIFYFILSLFMLFITVTYYTLHFQDVWSFATSSANGDIALTFAVKKSFISTFLAWFSALQTFTISYSIIFYCVILGIVFIILFNKNFKSSISKESNEFVILNLLSFFFILCVFSFQINQENRYLLPVCLIFIFILIHYVYLLKNKIVLYLLTLYFVIQYSILNITLLNLYPIDLSKFIPDSLGRMVVNQEYSYRQELLDILKYTCPINSKNQNIVAVDYLNLNANTLSYYSRYLNVSYANNCSYSMLSYERENLGLKVELGRILYEPKPYIIIPKKIKDPNRQKTIQVLLDRKIYEDDIVINKHLKLNRVLKLVKNN